MHKLKFLNHASYALETKNTILLHDPWFEGNAFNNGWGMKFQDMSNAEIIAYLKNSQKKIYIWYSHEHSDHFNISFLKESKKANLGLTILFQKTLDKRVIHFLTKSKFNVIECLDGKEYKLDNNFLFTVWRYSLLDSFTVSNLNGTVILNINDCVIQSIAQAKKIKERILKL